MKHFYFLSGLLIFLFAFEATAQLPGAGRDYIDGDGYTWNISAPIPNNILQVRSLSAATFEQAFILDLAGNNFATTDFAFEVLGRQVVAGPAKFAPSAPYQITRKIFVPDDSGWIRILDIYENLSSNPITTLPAFDVSGMLLSGSVINSSGTPPNWILASTAVGPFATIHMWGEGSVPSAGFSFSSNSFEINYDVDIPANGKVAYLYFASLSPDQATAEAKIAALSNPLEEDALFGLSLEERNLIANWEVGTDCAPPVIAFLPEDGCVNEEVLFQTDLFPDNPDITDYEYLWDFGDGTDPVIDELNPLHTYTAPGDYIVTLQVTERANTSCFSTQSESVTVTEPIPIDISPNPIVVCATITEIDLKQFVFHEGPIIGSFSDGDLGFISEDGIFSPTSYGVGMLEFQYTLGDIASCQSVAEGTIIVEEGEPVSIVDDLEKIVVLASTGTCQGIYEPLAPEVTGGCGEITVTGSLEAGMYEVGEYLITWTATDGITSATAEQVLEIVDAEAPQILSEAKVEVFIDPGSCTFTLTNDFLETEDNCGIEDIRFSFEGSTTEAPAKEPPPGDPPGNPDNDLPPGAYVVNWEVTDVNGNSTMFKQSIVVKELLQDITELEVTSPVKPGEEVNLTVAYSGNSIASVLVSWGDGENTEGEFTGGDVSASYIYSAEGVYQGSIIITDVCGNSVETGFTVEVEGIDIEEFFGVISGGGIFNSEMGYYIKDPDSQGKAIFGIYAFNKEGLETPRGSIFFYYFDKRFLFRGRDIQSVSVINDETYQIIANGTIGRNENATIQIEFNSADGSYGRDIDQIVVKISSVDQDMLVYDNTIKDPMGSEFRGRIRIRGIYNSKSRLAATDQYSNFDLFEEDWKLYPNPAVNTLNIHPVHVYFEEITYQVYDLQGHLMIEKTFGFEASNIATQLDVSDLKPGTYIFRAIDSYGENMSVRKFIKR